MMYRARVEISLKPDHSDPEGETTARSLRELNYPVESVGVNKVYTIILEASSLKKAKKQVDEMCARLLANPTKDNYRFKIEEIK
ncbi:MAG: phosphoribosylformylglycinamidine synthase subunit PurS [Thermoproteota archaeon]|nr:phosphoribosylformylglycinamidine synthase subunit PurS [Thermoproteota archaeon]